MAGSDANPFLKLESGLDEPVTLAVKVRLAATNEVTSEGEYEVPARSLRRIEVLGADRYRVTARAPFDSVTFECEPTCASATTAVFVTPRCRPVQTAESGGAQTCLSRNATISVYASMRFSRFESP
jgi:hypothetical protein